ncbi:hypothetical protein A0O34_00720 [Chryseobacterium glaciei]|uniref:Uncharacterized protein n=1 Tax=Chryseobacterium glaciei TaxID=1685010 RepID=A0A172XQA2_9FLAO|nr:hypothetical protein [Chryseobacterium glaciei]ANF49168.1 hypothetical protein A0O34_00720 [Chryseobacterium glaciei]
MGNLKEFVLLFRLPQEDNQLTNERAAKINQQWKKFIALIASQVKLVNVSRLSFEGTIIKSDLSVVHKTVLENGFFVSGNLTMKSETIENVILVAKKCPILLVGGTVEVRQTIPLN